MTCHNCQTQCRKFGKTRKGQQRFRCWQWRKTYSEGRTDNFFGMYTSTEKASHIEASGEGEHRYSPAEVVDSVPVPVWGKPDPKKICTSHIENQNLQVRMSMRRFTRLTNAFSKKWDNLKAAFAVWFAFYNFCRVHGALRITPAMEAGSSDHVWTMNEMPS